MPQSPYLQKWDIQRTTTQQQGGLTTARYKLDGPQAHGAEGSPTRKDSGDGLLVKAETQGPKTHMTLGSLSIEAQGYVPVLLEN